MSSSSSESPNIRQYNLITPANKKRNRNVLRQSANQKRYLGISQTEMYWLGLRAREVTDEKAVTRHRHSRMIAEKSWPLKPKIMKELENQFDNQYYGSNIDRRVAIKYLFIS
jgi:hypothetical protein